MLRQRVATWKKFGMRKKYVKREDLEGFLF
jgi:hypothetical protein